VRSEGREGEEGGQFTGNEGEEDHGKYYRRSRRCNGAARMHSGWIGSIFEVNIGHY